MEAAANMIQGRGSRKLRRDLRILAKFIAVFCRHQHRRAAKSELSLKTHNLVAIHGKPLDLCQECGKLLTHAFVKRTHCPLEPKPDCRKCPTHCYAPNYREQIREVMKYSGRRLVLCGRLHYLFHLFG